MIEFIKTEDGIDHYVVNYEGDRLPFFITTDDRKAKEISVSAGLLQVLQISTNFGNDFAKELYNLKIID